MTNEEIDTLFEAIDLYADKRAAVNAVLHRVGHDPSMAAYFAPQEVNERDKARAVVVKELARFVRAVVVGQIV